MKAGTEGSDLTARMSGLIWDFVACIYDLDHYM